MAEERSFKEALLDATKAVGSVVRDVVYDKLGTQGATEIAQALYNGQSNAFTPYGHAQAPLEVEGPATSYQDMLRDASQSAGKEQDRGMDR